MPQALPGATRDRKVYSVAELTRLIKGALEREFGTVWVEGEMSNLRRPPSGHIYFTIKDESAQLSVVMFRGDQIGLAFNPADGTAVQVYGPISVYERSGQYQIIARILEEGGTGALQAAFEKLKKKLFDEGLFDADRKKALPLLPRRIGVVTSPTGAAVRDILTVLRRRFPNLNVIVVPVKVQGDEAAGEIAAGIDALNRLGDIDVMIVGRGGGSLEDLWAFNEEIVARAIERSAIPVISAVGHEIDITISDLAADVRAATPSAAAEIVVERKDALESQLRQAARRLAMTLREQLVEARSRLRVASASYVFREPRSLVGQYRQRIDALNLRGGHTVRERLREAQQRADDAQLRMSHTVQSAVRNGAQEVRRIAGQLRAMNPLAVLERGYSVTLDRGGRLIRTVRALQAGDRIRTRVADGTFESEVVKSNDKQT